jgi:hypothetical protein
VRVIVFALEFVVQELDTVSTIIQFVGFDPVDELRLCRLSPAAPKEFAFAVLVVFPAGVSAKIISADPLRKWTMSGAGRGGQPHSSQKPGLSGPPVYTEELAHRQLTA